MEAIGAVGVAAETYSDGGMNFATVASIRAVMDGPALFGAAVAVDNLLIVLG